MELLYNAFYVQVNLIGLIFLILILFYLGQNGIPLEDDEQMDQAMDSDGWELDKEAKEEEAMTELGKWRAKLSSMNASGTELPDTLLGSMKLCPKQFFPYIHQSMKILVTMPVGTAEAERSFSAMKLIKSNLRTTMGNERLSCLALVHIHQDMSEIIQPNKVLQAWIDQGNGRRLVQSAFVAPS